MTENNLIYVLKFKIKKYNSKLFDLDIPSF